MGFKFSAVLILVIAAMGGLGYWYYNDTQERMAILNENNAKLETAVATNEEALKAQKEAFEAMARENEKLRTDFDAIKKRNDRLQEKLSRHDIGNLGVARPESTGKVLSTQSNNALRCFEIATGSPLTQEELKATKPSEINPECWEIANPNFDPNIQSDAWKRKNL
jgi:Tfp pilus assembly protein PilO